MWRGSRKKRCVLLRFKEKGTGGEGEENSLVLFYVVCVQLEQENEEAGRRNEAGGGVEPRQRLKNELQTAEQSLRDREDAAE